MLKYILITALIPAVILTCAADNNNPKTQQPYTSFQTPTPYRADHDIRTDAVIVYADDARIKTWAEQGYTVQTMYGFRTGDNYIKDHRDQVQTLADGTLHTCGPGSYYMVPTPTRIKAAVDYFTNAINNGTSAVIPEEPEFFSVTGYSDSFKKAWQDFYHEPWQDQASSTEARYKSERLKARMEYNMVKSIMDSAQKQKPSVRRMVACHSPVSYFGWGIIYPHYQCLTIPSLQEIVGQVWTGTARTPCAYAGVSTERTFENAFLEYSSLYNLVRGTDKRMWFLMDPLEDNPDRSMEDYHINYEKTLIASLLFPGVDSFEVMPWPDRIYGRVPGEFATEISSIINALQDMHNQKSAALDMGTTGIATFVADSMGWQRGAPFKSNFDSFYGLTLPLIYKGVPIQVAQLERAPDPGYLDPYKILFVSYDILKPMSPKYNQALADWVKKGGTLVYFGGTDAYNNLPEWWKDRGFASPQADLYSRLGIQGKLHSLSASEAEQWKPLAREKNRIRAMENKKTYTFDLNSSVQRDRTVYIRFGDSLPDDGWGALVESAKLTINGKTTVQFRAGTPEESRFIFLDAGSAFNGTARFADGDSYWVYKFNIPAGSKASLEVDMGNQFVVDATDQPMSRDWKITRGASSDLTNPNPLLQVPMRFPLTLCNVRDTELYHVADQIGSAVFEQKIGKGTLIHVGISPAYFASSTKAADLLRSITSYACDKAGVKYREQERIGIRRGKYMAMRTFSGEKQLTGSYISILDPKLKVVENPTINPQALALYYDVTPELSGTPKLLYASAKVESKSESIDQTTLKLSGPEKTKGVARLYTGGRTVESVLPAGAQVETDGDTVLITFDNQPKSVDIAVNWRKQ